MPVLELFLDPATDLHAIRGRYGDISSVEWCVHILAQKDSVADVMWTFPRVGPYVRAIQDVQHGRAGECAPPFVDVRDHHTERTLPKARQHMHRRTEPCSLLDFYPSRRYGGLLESETFLHLLPKQQPCSVCRVIALSLDDAGAPVRGRNPIFFAKEEGRLQQDAADLIILGRSSRDSPVARDSGSHLLLAVGTIFRRESAPGEAHGQGREVAEEPPTTM